jgi:MFS family permease
VTDLSRDNRLMVLALFLWASGEGLFIYLQPIYVQQLGADPVQIGGVLSLAGLSMTVSYLPGGILADRISRKTMMLGGWGLGLIAVLLMAAAHDWREFIPGAMLYTFSAFCVPAVSATIADAAGDVPLERVLTLVYAGFWAGSIVSPWVGGWLAKLIGMRTVYVIAAACFATSALVILQVRTQPVRARMSARRMPSSASLRSGATLGIIVFAIFLAMYIGQPLAPNFLRDTAGWPIERIGLLGSLHALGVTLLAPSLGRWSAVASRKLLGLLAAQALVWASLGLLLIGARAVPGIVLVAFFLRGGYGACRNLTNAHIAGGASPENRGAAFGLAETAAASAQMAAPYFAGWLYAAHPAAPIGAGLAFIPAAMLLTPILCRPSLSIGPATQLPDAAHSSEA